MFFHTLFILNEKMVTIAGLAAGVSHEINTPLTAIIQSYQLVNMGLSLEEKDGREKAAECNVDLVGQALLLSLEDYDMKKKYNIVNVCIPKESEPDSPSIICVTTEIEQVLLNLLKNSAQAMAAADPYCETLYHVAYCYYQ